jgi:hypothetical protein
MNRVIGVFLLGFLYLTSALHKGFFPYSIVLASVLVGGDDLDLVLVAARPFRCALRFSCCCLLYLTIKKNSRASITSVRVQVAIGGVTLSLH